MKILKSSGPNVDPCRTLTDIFTHSLKELFILQRWSPANKRLDEHVLKTSFVFVFRRRLQDVLIKTNIFVLLIRLHDVFKTFSKRLQDIFKTFWRRLAKISSRLLQDVFKTFSKHLQDVLQRCPQDAFKTYHQVILLLLKSFQDVFKTYWGVLQR